MHHLAERVSQYVWVICLEAGKEIQTDSVSRAGCSCSEARVVATRGYRCDPTLAVQVGQPGNFRLELIKSVLAS